MRLRVAQYRIDDSGSGTSERLAEDRTQQVQPRLNADGGLSVQARFELPGDAPGQGARRGQGMVGRRPALRVTVRLAGAIGASTRSPVRLLSRTA